jgi:predicted metal-binding membrane protein
MRRPLIASLCSALLPAGEKREIVAAASFFFIVGYLGLASAISIAAAFCQWMLESIAVIGEDARIGNPMLAGLALAGIGVWHVSQFLRNGKAPCSFASDRRKGLSQGWRHGCSSLGCCLTMVCLQLAGGVMNVGLMIGLTLWMLLEAVLPWKRHLAAATGIALLTAGGLTIASAIG